MGSLGHQLLALLCLLGFNGLAILSWTEISSVLIRIVAVIAAAFAVLCSQIFVIIHTSRAGRLISLLSALVFIGLAVIAWTFIPGPWLRWPMVICALAIATLTAYFSADSPYDDDLSRGVLTAEVASAVVFVAAGLTLAAFQGFKIRLPLIITDGSITGDLTITNGSITAGVVILLGAFPAAWAVQGSPKRRVTFAGGVALLVVAIVAGGGLIVLRLAEIGW